MLKQMQSTGQFFGFLIPGLNMVTGTIAEIVKSLGTPKEDPVTKVPSSPIKIEHPNEFEIEGGQWFHRDMEGSNTKALSRCKPPLKEIYEHFNMEMPIVAEPVKKARKNPTSMPAQAQAVA